MSERQDEAEVRRRAVAFRCALDVVKPEHPRLPEFPTGWCTMASMLLGEYLQRVGLGEFRTRAGTRNAPRFASHAWLEQGDLIVDITADQFPDFDQPVTVDRGSAWHRQWAPAGGGGTASLAFYQGDDYQELVAETFDRLHRAAEECSHGLAR